MNFLLDSFKGYVAIESDRDESWRGFERSALFETFLPCVKILPADWDSSVARLRLVHRFSAEQHICLNAGCTEVHDAWERTPPPYIYVLIEQLIERARQELSIYSLRASSVSINGRGVLILADNWHGKTSTAIYLALHGQGNVMANNRTILKGMDILGGSQFFDVKETFWQYFPEVSGRLRSRATRTPGGRYTFQWPEICQRDFPVPVIAIVLSHINDGAKEARLVPRSEAIWYLLRQASFVIRGDCVLFDGKVASPNYDSPSLSQERLAWIRSLTQEVPLIYVAGSLQEICDYVTSLAQGQG